MRRFFHVHATERAVGADVFGRLKSLAPDLSEKWLSFGIERPEGDQTIQALRSTLSAAGVSPVSFGRKTPDGLHYHLMERREYDPSELEQFPLLQLEDRDTKRWILASSRAADGRIVVDLPNLKKRRPRGGIVRCGAGYLVPDRVKRLLEGGGLVGPYFKPTILDYDCDNPKPHDWGEIGHEPWWELTASLWMPRISLSTELLHYGTREPVTEQERNALRLPEGVIAAEGFLALPELRFERQAIERAMMTVPGGEWDLARTREPLGFPWLDNHPLICSQRFYRFCQNEGVEGTWVPVHVEKGEERAEGDTVVSPSNPCDRDSSMAQRIKKIELEKRPDGGLQIRWRHLPEVPQYFVEWAKDGVEWYVVWVVEDEVLTPDPAGFLTYEEDAVSTGAGYYRIVPAHADKPDYASASPAVRFP